MRLVILEVSEKSPYVHQCTMDYATQFVPALRCRGDTDSNVAYSTSFCGHRRKKAALRPDSPRQVPRQPNEVRTYGDDGALVCTDPPYRLRFRNL